MCVLYSYAGCLTCSSPGADCPAVDPPTGGLDQDPVPLSWDEPVELEPGESGGLRAVGQHSALLVQELQNVSVRHAQSCLPAHLKATGEVKLLHLESRHGQGHLGHRGWGGGSVQVHK